MLFLQSRLQCLPKHPVPGVCSGQRDATPLRSPNSYSKYFLTCLRSCLYLSAILVQADFSAVASWVFLNLCLCWRWPWTTQQRLSLWWVKWKIHPWLSELKQTQGVRMQPQGFPFCWGYPPSISAGRPWGRSGKVCSSWPWMKHAQDVSSWCEAFPKKVLLPRSGALCAQKGQGCRHCAATMSRGWGYAQWAKKSRSMPALRAPHMWKPASMGCLTGFYGRDFHLNSTFNQFMYNVPCYAINCERSRKRILPCEISMAKNSYARSMEIISCVVKSWLCLW